MIKDLIGSGLRSSSGPEKVCFRKRGVLHQGRGVVCAHLRAVNSDHRCSFLTSPSHMNLQQGVLVNGTSASQRIVQVNASAEDKLGKGQGDASAGDKQGPQVSIDNSTSKNSLLIIKVKEQGGIFRAVTLLLGSEGILTKEYQETKETDHVTHQFAITDANNKQITDQSKQEELINKVRQVTNPSTSSLPAIYGIFDKSFGPDTNLDTQDLSDLDSVNQVGRAARQLQEAAGLVLEIEQKKMAKGGTDDDETQEALLFARAILQRKSAYMEGVLQKQITPEEVVPKVEVLPPSEGDDKVQVGPRGEQKVPTIGPAAGDGHQIILQGFNWESCHKGNWYDRLMEKENEIRKIGFTSVWFPPPTDSVSDQGYLPRDLYKLDSKYGSADKLEQCIQKFRQPTPDEEQNENMNPGSNGGLHVIADIVINHRCAHQQDDRGKWNVFGGRMQWNKSHVCRNNRSYGGTGSHKTFDDYEAAPNIDHDNPQVQKDIKEWMQMLRHIGFDGWRFDFVKGYKPEYAKMYVNATKPFMSFGEYWTNCEYSDRVLNYNQDNHRQSNINWIDSTDGSCASFDFTTKGILQEAVARKEYWRLIDAKGRPPGMMGLWPSRSITFVDNHDTGSTLQHWPFPHREIAQGYAYILTHPGTPCVFWDHLYSHDEGLRRCIREVIQVRWKNGINFKSKVKICRHESDCYAAIIDDKIAMKIGPGNWSPKDSGRHDAVKVSHGRRYDVY